MPGSVRLGVHLDGPRGPRHPVEHGVDEPGVHPQTSAIAAYSLTTARAGRCGICISSHAPARRTAVKHRQPVQCPPFGETVFKRRVQRITVTCCGCQRIEVPVINVLDARLRMSSQ